MQRRHTVGFSWKRVETWLANYAPKILSSLQPPSSQEDRTVVEEEFQQNLPPSWHALYEGHNGLSESAHTSLMHGLYFLPLDRVQSILHSFRDSPRDKSPARVADEGVNPTLLYNPNWLPLCDDWASCYVMLDLDPSPEGAFGQVILVDYDNETVLRLGASLNLWFSGFADALESGRYRLSNEALQEGNEFLNCDKDCDVINWHLSKRWAHLDK